VRDGIALGLSFAYVLLVVALAEGLRRSGRVSFDVSRKIIHAGIGTWVVPTVMLFHSPWVAAVPPAVFVLLNFLSYRYRWTRAMDAEGGDNVGTILFPLAFALLLPTFWRAEMGRAAIAGGLLTLAWGDAAAALVGVRWGRHRYKVGSGWRSLEGSTAMLVFSCVAATAAGLVVGPHPFPFWLVLSGAVVATLLEAGSLRGSDNLIVPIGTTLYLWDIPLLVR
jgi:phytol kinase